jgi:hypothetical protein
MIGRNQIHLNSETVMQALQEYFDARYLDAHRIKAVSARPTVSNGYISADAGCALIVEVEPAIPTPPTVDDDDE